jgi:hypothetical protein
VIDFLKCRRVQVFVDGALYLHQDATFMRDCDLALAGEAISLSNIKQYSRRRCYQLLKEQERGASDRILEVQVFVDGAVKTTHSKHSGAHKLKPNPHGMGRCRLTFAADFSHDAFLGRCE